MSLFRRSRAVLVPSGRWDGPVTYCSDPVLVPFEGHYAVDLVANRPDVDRPVHWVSIQKEFTLEDGSVVSCEIDGWWEHGKR